MKKSKILLTAQIEFARHSWTTFPVEFEGETAQVLGCPRCRKSLATIEQYNEHLKADVLLSIVELVLTLGKQ
jgi:hypothetical protein